MHQQTLTAATKTRAAFSTKDLVLIGMFTAVLAAISQISLPMPTGVPITIQMFGVALTGSILGFRRGFFAALCYILLGAVGVPVFANFRGGLDVLAGLTGGYIMLWPAMAALCGAPLPKGIRKGTPALVLAVCLGLFGMMLSELFGAYRWATLSVASQSPKTFAAIMAYSFAAFIPKDAILTALGVILGRQIRRTLIRGNFL